MADEATQQMVVGASPERTWQVLTTFDEYPTWAADLKAAEVVARDDEGRPLEVAFRAAAMGRSTTYRLRYDYAGAPGKLAWVLESGDLERELDGAYHLRAGDDPGSTEVVYELSVDLVLPIPGFVKRRAEARIIKTALADLKALIESGAAS